MTHTFSCDLSRFTWQVRLGWLQGDVPLGVIACLCARSMSATSVWVIFSLWRTLFPEWCFDSYTPTSSNSRPSSSSPGGGGWEPLGQLSTFGLYIHVLQVSAEDSLPKKVRLCVPIQKRGQVCLRKAVSTFPPLKLDPLFRFNVVSSVQHHFVTLSQLRQNFFASVWTVHIIYL